MHPILDVLGGRGRRRLSERGSEDRRVTVAMVGGGFVRFGG